MKYTNDIEKKATGSTHLEKRLREFGWEGFWRQDIIRFGVFGLNPRLSQNEGYVDNKVDFRQSGFEKGATGSLFQR